MIERAELRKADFVRFPKEIDGTRCTNCKYFGDKDREFPFPHCEYKGTLKLGDVDVPLDLVGLRVGHNTCCVAWDAKGVTHVGAVKVGVNNHASDR